MGGQVPDLRGLFLRGADAGRGIDQVELLGHIKPMPLAPIHIPFLYGDIALMVEEFMLMPSGMALIIQFGHGKILAQRHALKTWRYATWCVPSHEKACQREEMILYKKGAPAPAANRNRGWHGAVRAPYLTRLPVL